MQTETATVANQLPGPFFFAKKEKQKKKREICNSQYKFILFKKSLLAKTSLE